MSEIKLSTGRVVTVDLNRVSMREYRALFDPQQPAADGDATLAKGCGLTVSELMDMSHTEYREVASAFFRTAREPLADPNSASASSSP